MKSRASSAASIKREAQGLNTFTGTGGPFIRRATRSFAMRACSSRHPTWRTDDLGRTREQASRSPDEPIGTPRAGLKVRNAYLNIAMREPVRAHNRAVHAPERADHGMVRAVHAGETPVHASGGSVPLRMQPCTSSAHLTARTPRRNRRADDAHPSPPSCSEAHGARTAAQANRTTEPLIETKTYPSGTALTSIARDSRRRRT